jgi:hypothetical protein
LKAREWVLQGRQAGDPFAAFSCFWRGFNNLYSNPSLGPERETIKHFLSEHLSNTKAQDILQANQDCVAYLLSQPVIDMRGNGKDTADHIELFNSAVNSSAKLQEVFMVIYQIRCNLEHGQKSPSRDRDIQLCQHAAPLVASVVECVT